MKPLSKTEIICSVLRKRLEVRRSQPFPGRPGLIPSKATGICSQQSSDVTWRNNRARSPSPPDTVLHDKVNEKGSEPGPGLPRAPTLQERHRAF
ncbi:hypothetical protein Q5P01_007100 [Channa striata]|uniref:Uncharacterized protein n=1 Tax=Channa striata TaxID=64152 RepID=A0AA88STH0_CHASR|nr:hypothetical protein Q5P01_007100 [Channa striata]